MAGKRCWLAGWCFGDTSVTKQRRLSGKGRWKTWTAASKGWSGRMSIQAPRNCGRRDMSWRRKWDADDGIQLSCKKVSRYERATETGKNKRNDG